MATSTRTWSILGSLGISLVLILGAYIISAPWFGISKVDAQNSQALLEAYAGKDTDGDGLFDWQEALYGTHPENAYSVDETLNDKEAVAQGLIEPRFKSETARADDVPASFYTIVENPAAKGTLTDTFAREFFERYLTNRGAEPPGPEALQSFVTDAVADLNARTEASPRYSARDIVQSGSSDEDVNEYLETMDATMVRYSPSYNQYGVLEQFGNYVEHGSMESLERIRYVGERYTATGEAIIKVPVPPRLYETHIALANAYIVLGETVQDMGKMDTDPLLGLVAANRYIDVWQATAETLVTLTQAVREAMHLK